MANILSSGQLTLTDLNDAIISGTTPVNPTVGTLWIDSSLTPNMLKRWNGSSWDNIGELDPNNSVVIGTIQATLGNMANDNVIDINERSVVKEKLTDIIGYVMADTDTLPDITTLDASNRGEVYNVRKSARVAGISVTDPNYINVATKYNDLVTYLAGLSGYVVTDTIPPNVTASISGGTFTTTQSVTLTADETATIYYTIDGSTPTVSSSVYSTPISISSSKTLKYFAKDTAGNSSSIYTQNYIIDSTAPTVTASPIGGTFTSTQTVTLTPSETATIYYTIDGSTPTTSSTVYGSSISISSTSTLKYFAKDTAGNIGGIVTQNYIIDSIAPTVTASPVGGTYSSTQSITLTPSETATIYYTTDGSTPTTSSSVYSTAISISSTATLKYFAVDTAGNIGTIQSQAYTITALDTTPPTVNVSPLGGLFNANQTITLTPSESATIYYTLDGSTPTQSSAIYSSAITITSTATLKYFAVDTANNVGTIQSQTYTIDKVNPTVSINITGGTYNSSVSITLTPSESATIYYTTNGTTPTTSSTVYSTAINISANTTLKYFAKDTAGNSGTTYTQTYVIDTVAPTVSINVAGGTYSSTQIITLTPSETATIYYTTNGTTPTTSSSVYSTSLTISANTTLKYFAKDTAGNSGTTYTQTYTITAPTLSAWATPVGGSYGLGQSVTLQASDGTATIYYTKNGTTPTTSSTVYSTAISFPIAGTFNVQFFAKDSSNNTTQIYSEIYNISSGGGQA